MDTYTKTTLSLVTDEPALYGELKLHFEPKHELVWCYMAPRERACLTPGLLMEMNSWFERLRTRQGPDASQPIRYHVVASAVPGVYNYGGDLELFIRLVQAGDREGLRRYAGLCNDALHYNLSRFGRDLTTIALVQGDALGGACQVVFSHDVVVAERGVRMGMPETLFNLPPGLGALPILTRKVGPAMAERMIMSGESYTAEALHEMGLVHVLAEPGEGELAVYDFIRRQRRMGVATRALRRMQDRLHPVTREQLDAMVDVWLDAALSLSDRDLRMIDRLNRRQKVTGERQRQVAR